MEVERRVAVHVEVCLTPTSSAAPSDVKQHVSKFLEAQTPVFKDGPVELTDDRYLQQHVQSIVIVDLGEDDGSVSFWQAALDIHVFQLSEEGMNEEHTETEDGGEGVAACHQWVLPAVEYKGLWESLIYDHAVKKQLLEYTTTAMLFSDKKVNNSIIAWNRVVLLHGPPGTGKTSLCKALAQKLSIRLIDRYPCCQLLEINAHSLFSKWFSESGKLVMKLFQHIQELVEDEDSLVCVLIDEVESLTAARKAAMSGTEPSDAIRVVNALLTQIDRLSHRDNVIILTTSNITEAIDLAFVDRADIKQYIGLPSVFARYEILHSCVQELGRVGIISPYVALPNYRQMAAAAGGSGSESSQGSPSIESESSLAAGNLLLRTAQVAEGLSGRALRKLPFQAHAFYLQRSAVSLLEYLQGLYAACEHEHQARSQMNCQ